MNRFFTIAAAAFALTTLAAALPAGAATIRVQCEQRAAQRSKISVDGRDLAAGQYRAEVLSAGRMASTPPEAAVRGEAEFDFDSNPADIAAGATAIAPTFIGQGTVTGRIVRTSDGSTVASDTVACRVRSK